MHLCGFVWVFLKNIERERYEKKERERQSSVHTTPISTPYKVTNNKNKKKLILVLWISSQISSKQQKWIKKRMNSHNRIRRRKENQKITHWFSVAEYQSCWYLKKNNKKKRNWLLYIIKVKLYDKPLAFSWIYELEFK